MAIDVRADVLRTGPVVAMIVMETDVRTNTACVLVSIITQFQTLHKS